MEGWQGGRNLILVAVTPCFLVPDLRNSTQCDFGFLLLRVKAGVTGVISVCVRDSSETQPSALVLETGWQWGGEGETHL